MNSVDSDMKISIFNSRRRTDESDDWTSGKAIKVSFGIHPSLYHHQSVVQKKATQFNWVNIAI